MQEDKKIEEYVISGNLDADRRKSWKNKLSILLNGKFFIPIVIVLIASISFSLGRISGLQEKRPPVRVINSTTGEVKGISTENITQSPSETSASAVPSVSSGQVVASKNGTKYHYPWCAGAKQISPQNLITFDSIEEARAAGYTPASNCKGLK